MATEEKLTKGERRLEAEWIVAQSILGELVTNDLSRSYYESHKDDGLLMGKISWETWKRYYTENLDAMLSKLETSTEYKDFDGAIQLIEGSITKEGILYTEYFLNFKKNKKTGELTFLSVNIDKVSDYLISIHKFKTWFGVKHDYSFNWNGKTMQKDARGIIKCECEAILKNYCKRNVVDEIFEKIKRKSKISKDDFEMDDTNFINLDNGVWDIEQKKLLPHDSKYNFQHIHSIIKNDDSLDVHNCPIWLKFINETLYPEDVSVMQEWFGFLLHREYFIKKGMICEGEQDTGKSVLMDTAIMFIGEENKSGLSLQKITSGSDFIKLSLKNKNLNAFDDLSSKDLNDGGAFKVATGGGFISGEEKFGECQQFRSFAKQMFNTNKIPPVKDNDDLAYFGRWMPIKFDNIPEKLDPFLRKKIWTEKEMSGILNWALEGLYRLLENGQFSYIKTSEEIKQMMEISSCPLVAFTNDVLEKEENNIVSKDDMYKVYSAWCEKSKRQRLTKEMLGRQLPKHCNYVLAGKHKVRIWKNAKINENWREILRPVQKCLDDDTSDTNIKLMSTFSKESNNNICMGNIKLKKVSEEPPKKQSFADEKLEKEALNSISSLGKSNGNLTAIKHLNASRENTEKHLVEKGGKDD